MPTPIRAPLRVAYTLEQCWHTVPGGTAVAALRVLDALLVRTDVAMVPVAGRHPAPPDEPWRPPVEIRQLPLRRPWLYEAWLRLGRPRVERATGAVDVCHSTTVVPAPSAAPSVVTVHDLAFLRYPQNFTRHGVAMMSRSLGRIRSGADLVLCSSRATMADLVDAGVDETRLRHVPLGVDPARADGGEVDRVRLAYDLPERFVLFVGTLEPRKNLTRLAAAVARLDSSVPLVVAGSDGWGADRGGIPPGDTARFLGFVPAADLPGLYGAATVFGYPTEWEGFGLPVAEAMAQGTPVVTSRGTSTDEVAGGAAVLVDPLDTDDIARGLAEALVPERAAELAAAGPVRAAELSWAATAAATVEAYREVAA